MGRRRSYSDDALKTAVAASKSMLQVLTRLGLKVGGGTHADVKRKIANLGIDVSHMLGQAIRKGGTNNFNDHLKIPWEKVFVENFQGSRKCVRRRLIQEGFLEEKCSECKMGPQWNGKPLSLQLEHKNGKKFDYRLENLTLLCPNCHSQTPTFAGRNKKRVSSPIGSRQRTQNAFSAGSSPA